MNTIAWTAEKNKDSQVSKMIYSLSNIFRVSFNVGNDEVAIQEEIEFIKNYLFLQESQFSNKLSYEFEVNPKLLNFIIPKLLIQPLVENSLIHGIEPLSNENGFIQIIVDYYEKDPELIKIEVNDDGIGISPDEMRKLERNKEIESGKHYTGSALWNIKSRIQIFYGEKARLSIRSVEGVGTNITILLPVTGGGIVC